MNKGTTTSYDHKSSGELKITQHACKQLMIHPNFKSYKLDERLPNSEELWVISIQTIIVCLTLPSRLLSKQTNQIKDHSLVMTDHDVSRST